MAVLSYVGTVEATRVLPDDFANTNHLHTYSTSVYQKAKLTMSYWLQQLASVLSHVGVEATRVLPENFANTNHLDTYSMSVYQKAKFIMSYWPQRLDSGPSPRGPGH
ncbi:hypothetical protein PTKIN_Ptkin17bG0027600 [Pterospermum kingtungense]